MKRIPILFLAACLLTAPSFTRAEETPPPATPEAAVELTDAQLAEQLAETIQKILATVTDPAQQKEQIALLVAKTVKTYGTRAAGILAALTTDLNQKYLPVVSAAAVMAAGNGSPQVLRAMMNARAGNPRAVAAVRQAAVNPVSILGTTVAAQVAPEPTPPTTIARTTRPAANNQVAAAATAAAEPEIAGGGEPPPPPPIPSRPPALPYRGQQSPYL